MLITKFFDHQEILITGGSGFIGKALIEKLLRSCPNVGKIYVLLRNKKNKNAEERLRDILNTSLYNRVRQEQPQAFRKVYAIEGDCSQLGLGISTEDLLKLQSVTIIYHSAASVRFDDALRDAVLLNTRGTFELIKIAETLKRLKVFVHVSTTYCNPDKTVVDEKVYPPYADWRTTIKLAETYDTETLNIFNLKYGNYQPNTYTFTKSMAEHIVNDFRDKLPVIIFRPSVVISSISEPVPGWVDNFNGPVGMLIACGVGIFRTNFGDPDIITDFVPVDVVVRAMLIATYKKGLEGHHPPVSTTDVINCAAANVSPITLGEVINTGRMHIRDNPFEKTLWLPGGSITRCRTWNFIRFITLQIFMAIFIDCILRIAKEKPFLLRLQRRIFAANIALHYFATTYWIFNSDNFNALDKMVPKSEFDKFAFLQFADVEHVDFICKAIRGAKEFLLLESPESSKSARMRMKFFLFAHYLIQLTGILLILRFIIRFFYKKYFIDM